MSTGSMFITIAMIHLSVSHVIVSVGVVSCIALAAGFGFGMAISNNSRETKIAYFDGFVRGLAIATAIICGLMFTTIECPLLSSP